MTAPERSPRGTISLWSTIFSSRPWASRSATMLLARLVAVEADVCGRDQLAFVGLVGADGGVRR